ncbi:tRNA pseudouridine(13) synthase TruD [Haloplanus aerogenes]|uniref:Probable tRNA pseudouridine synthase D n=1 Tax=Haloplanus aerogenes TaxID=660522 RepID=A0A3G8QQ21_9EURY|nr:tRNA pseudouridine(13) synthase TruD [Haloplanus aerogenes]AZH24255.1 tRNA pseudouridine(13) synthase TruD [Haloplanus aerogenes]RMB24114.1 TruD family tRNA pseudouridine synthase [Haloplanus aerogenes]
MREAHPLERQVGIDYYVSDAPGVGGRLRAAPADFRVREIEAVEPEPLDADPGAYPHLLVRATLTDWDTNDFAGALSDALGISRERVSWAGTKDKRAVTTQLFSIREVDPDDLPDLSGADIEPLGRVGRNLEFGDLAGNAFEIRISDPERPDAVDAITDTLTDFGGGHVAVPNVFGHQRFGSRRPVTHEVGLHVVREEWREAVLTYAGNPAESEPERTQQARATVDDVAASADPDWQTALDAMPGHLGYERSMLHALVENGGEEPADFRAALETVPWNLQRLFVNAAQSYAFNRMLSERLRRGLPFDRPVAGDVVAFADADAPEGFPLPDTDRLQRVSADRVDVVTRHCERGRAFVTAPLVGTETELGDGEPGDIERDVLDDLNLAPADFDLPGNFESTGTRRAILVGTDLDVDRNPLTLSFSLPRGSYATAVLREYLKVDPRDL